ncbi:MAG: peptidoglycan-associated lipoprotein Pal [Candidatus Polarisedimenticolaceae bacterium]|nr:peptidoglycan-associated lipoprotein Pal [Candidatus Polarisedimenticolaceae bacterium]
MKRSTTIKLLPLVMVALLFAGCSSTPNKDVAEVSDQSTTAEGAETSGANGYGEGSDAATMGATDSAEWRGSPLENPDSLLSTKVIYFDLDSSEIKADSRDVIRAHAAYLAATPSAQVMLEGHGDERGTREYNLALGERRAKSVRMVLTAEGAPNSQVTIISYGEERPVSDEHDESGWSLNRRVEFIY